VERDSSSQRVRPAWLTGLPAKPCHLLPSTRESTRSPSRVTTAGKWHPQLASSNYGKRSKYERGELLYRGDHRTRTIGSS